MRRFLLDTNVISNATKPTPSDALMAWLADQEDESLFISTLSLAEIWRGILDLPEGRKRRDLEVWFAGPTGPPTLFARRILSFDQPAALAWGELMARGRANGRPRSALDMMVAAIALANGCVVVTENERHFRDVMPFLNPMRPSSG